MDLFTSQTIYYLSGTFGCILRNTRVDILDFYTKIVINNEGGLNDRRQEWYGKRGSQLDKFSLLR